MRGETVLRVAEQLDRERAAAAEAFRRYDEKRKRTQMAALVRGLEEVERARAEGREAGWWPELGPLTKPEREAVRRTIAELVTFDVACEIAWSGMPTFNTGVPVW